MDHHIRCYRATTGEAKVLSPCPCSCHVGSDLRPNQRADWTAHNDLPCESWINARFALEQAQVDIYRRTGRPAGEHLSGEQARIAWDIVNLEHRQWVAGQPAR